MIMGEKRDTTLRSVTSRGKRTFRYRTVAGASKRARQIVGARPRIFPGNYLVGPNGDCLFVVGAELSEIYPHLAEARNG